MYENPYQYYPQYPQYQPVQQQVPQAMPYVQNNNVRIKMDLVQNRTAADVYRVDPGMKVILMDVDNACVYVRERTFDGKVISSDYDLIPHKDEPVVVAPPVDLSGYVKAEDIPQIVADEVEKRMAQMIKPSRRQKSEEEQ